MKSVKPVYFPVRCDRCGRVELTTQWRTCLCAHCNAGRLAALKSVPKMERFARAISSTGEVN